MIRYKYKQKEVGDRMDLNERIRQLRLESKLTARKFGSIFNVSESTISLYESGKRTPNKDLILNISNYFNVSTDYLLGKSDLRYLELQYLISLGNFDIAVEIKKIIMQIESNEAITFNDELLAEDIKILLAKSLQVIIETGDIIVSNLNADSVS